MGQLSLLSFRTLVILSFLTLVLFINWPDNVPALLLCEKQTSEKCVLYVVAPSLMPKENVL